MFNWTTLFYGTLLASVDIVMMPIAKMVNKGTLSVAWMALATLVYALDPWIFLKSLNGETMMIMNMLWNMMSNIVIVGTGYILFSERVSMVKSVGIVLSFISILLMCWE